MTTEPGSLTLTGFHSFLAVRNTFCFAVKMSIPVVDFGANSLNVNESDVADEQLRNLSEELKTAFTEVGFVFLKNTGITQEEVRTTHYIQKCILLEVWEYGGIPVCFSRTGGSCHGRFQEILPAAG